MASFTVSWSSGAGVYQNDIYLKPKNSGTYQMVASVGSTVTSYVINGLQDNIIYLIKIKSFCDTGTPVETSPIERIKITCPVLTLTPACNGVINYSFPHLGGDISAYDVILYSNTDTLLTTQTKTVSATVTGSFTSLSPVTVYKVRVVPKAGTFSKTDCVQSTTTTLMLAPTVTGHPQSVARCDDGPNSITTLTASFSGSSLTYSWYRNGVLISNGGNYSGATTASLTIQNAGSVLGSFTCKASNVCGEVTTNAAVITLLADTTISVAPSTIPTCVTDPINLSVTAGGESLTYQWQKSTDGGTTYSNVSGATNSTYTIAAGTAVEGDKYRVVVNSTCGPEIASTAATVDTVVSPVINTQPTSQQVCSGSNGTFTVAYTAENPTATIWQEQLGGIWYDINGATGTTYSTSTVGTYRFKVSNICGTVYSNTAALSNYTPVAFTSTASGVSKCPGELAAFNNTVSGTVTSYQWSLSTDGGTVYTDISGATTDSYSIASVLYSQNGYKYKLTVVGPCNTISNITDLTVYQTVSITAQPSNQTVCVGTNAIFSAAAQGSGISAYQWEVSTNGGSTWSDVSGATTNTLTLTGVTAGMSGYRYRLKATGNCNTATSNSAILTVQKLLLWDNTTTAVTRCPGDSAFLEAATYNGVLVSQSWQLSTDGGSTWSTISGQTGSTLSLTNIQYSQNGYQYRSIAVGTCNTLTLPAIILTVHQPLSIGTQPQNQTICSGSNATFSVSTTGLVLVYQWQESSNSGSTWTNIIGATSSTLTLTAPDISKSGYQYRVVITGCTVVTSSAALLTINPGAAITAQPTNQTVCQGGTATFSVTATGSGLVYQWQEYNGTIWADILEGTSGSITFTNVQLVNNGKLLRVNVVASCGTITSDTAQLTVNSSSPIWVNRDINVYWVCVGVDKYYEQIDTNACSATYNQTQTGSFFASNSTDCGYVIPPNCNPPAIVSTTLTYVSPCPCPAGYVASPDLSECVQEITVAATEPTASLSSRTLVAKNCACYGGAATAVYTGGYEPSNGLPVGATILDYSAFWRNFPANTVNGPMNRCAVWTNFTVDNQRIGFSICLNTTQDKTYLVGVGSDNFSTIKLNGNTILTQDPNMLGQYWYNDYNNRTAAFGIWHIYPIFIPAGNNVIEVSGNNQEDIAAVGVEIYDGTPAQILAAQSYAELGQRLIFSTKDIVGTQVVSGTDGVGYTCPDNSYVIKPCGVATPVCYKVLTTTCNNT